MDKKEIVLFLKEFFKKIKDCRNTVYGSRSKQVQNKTILKLLEDIASEWFDSYDPLIRKIDQIEDNTKGYFHDSFGKLLEYSTINPTKQNVASTLDNIIDNFSKKIILPIQKDSSLILKSNNLARYLEGLRDLELDYMKEAIDCANMGKNRAAIMLGWCSAIDRMHKIIELHSFEKFNRASEQMFNIKTGRYKRFTKKFEIHNLSDLRMSVFDSDLLWVLEFMLLIDGNEHEKLQVCFTYRNICSHPGDAKVTPENLESFFSDLHQIIFNNYKFKKINKETENES